MLFHFIVRVTFANRDTPWAWSDTTEKHVWARSFTHAWKRAEDVFSDDERICRALKADCVNNEKRRIWNEVCWIEENREPELKEN